MALMPVDEALRRVLDGANALPAEYVAVADTHGRVLAEDLAARRTQPPEAMSALDGYAVRACDIASVPITLNLIGEAAAGRVFAQTLAAGQAVRIFTGGVVPPGADTIVIQENTTRDGDTVEIRQTETAGRHVRKAGLDFRAGDVRLRRGKVFTARDLALAAAMNHAAVPVHRSPRVAILATGDELVLPGADPAPGQIVLSNGPALAAIARREGGVALDLGIVPDRVDATVAAIRRARAWGADVLVTTGGASVGEHDLVQQSLAAEGMDLAFWKVALRPGKPLMSGMLGGMRVLGLPGNPVSALVCAELFLVPLTRGLAGRSDVMRSLTRAVFGTDMAANDERQDYMRATLERGADGVLIATTVQVQDSSMMSALAAADCLVVREPHAPAAKTGEPCDVLVLEN